MEIKLLDTQREWLESILNENEGSWILEAGFELNILYRIRDILERNSYGSFDKKVLNDIRELWVSSLYILHLK